MVVSNDFEGDNVTAKSAHGGLLAPLNSEQTVAMDELVRLGARACSASMAFVAIPRGSSVCVEARYGMAEFSLTHVGLTALIMSAINGNRSVPGILGPVEVLQDPSARFIASVPIKHSHEELLGVLCIADRSPLQLTEAQYDSLALIGRQIGRLIDAWELEAVLPREEPIPASFGMAFDGAPFQTLLDNLPDLVLVKGPGSRIMWANRAFCEYYGMTATELRSLIDKPIVEPDYTLQYVRDDAYVFETGQVLDIPVEPITRFDGEVRSFHTIKAPIRNAIGEVVLSIGTSRDITDSRLKEEKAQLETRLSSVASLAAGIAHEVNTPIQFIGDNIHFLQDCFRGFAEIIDACRRFDQHKDESTVPDLAADIATAVRQLDVNYVSDEIPRALEESLNGIEAIAQLVSAMKEFSSPQGGQRALTDLNRSIKNAVAVSKNEWETVAKMCLILDPTLPPIPVFPGMLGQALLNLISNAATATAQLAQLDGGSLGTITIDSSFDDDWATIAISDTGPGIPANIRKRIFDPFFTTKEVGSGRGHGLAFVYSTIVRHHGGHIDLQSAVGHGSRFVMRLPLHVPAAAG